MAHANSTAPSWLGVPRCLCLQIGSRDGEVEHEMQSGYLFDPALLAP
jgi:hypothetical protein